MSLKQLEQTCVMAFLQMARKPIKHLMSPWWTVFIYKLFKSPLDNIPHYMRFNFESWYLDIVDLIRISIYIMMTCITVWVKVKLSIFFSGSVSVTVKSSVTKYRVRGSAGAKCTDGSARVRKAVLWLDCVSSTCELSVQTLAVPF